MTAVPPRAVAVPPRMLAVPHGATAVLSCAAASPGVADGRLDALAHGGPPRGRWQR
ncbi:hypothetical protein ACFOWE_06600 [Planomonospora corallina]|uniref:Ig-like domain-containing protein n=1 Tax=Planomonospora corallina TaxID=1806052 RepID=A0ABV8I451_9ACTN